MQPLHTIHDQLAQCSHGVFSRCRLPGLGDDSKRINQRTKIAYGCDLMENDGKRLRVHSCKSMVAYNSKGLMGHTSKI